MNRYRVFLERTYYYEVDVEAHSEQEAKSIANLQIHHTPASRYAMFERVSPLPELPDNG